MECYEKAVTKNAVIAAFQGRGIRPWDPAKAIANATRACPTVDYIEAHSQLQTLGMAYRVVDQIMSFMVARAVTQRMALQQLNTPVKSSELTPHKRRAKRTTATSPPVKNAPKLVSSDEESDFALESDTEVMSYESDPEPRGLVRADPAFECSFCEHGRANGKVQVACTGCNQFWLCRTCEFTSNALASHQETCKHCEGRVLRKRR